MRRLAPFPAFARLGPFQRSRPMLVRRRCAPGSDASTAPQQPQHARDLGGAPRLRVAAAGFEWRVGLEDLGDRAYAGDSEMVFEGP